MPRAIPAIFRQCHSEGFSSKLVTLPSVTIIHIMGYASIDALQTTLAESVFNERQDAKKAVGRALGTLVELIAYYLLRQWGLARSISIERGLAEYGNKEITHNVEFLLHPHKYSQALPQRLDGTVSFAKLSKLLGLAFFDGYDTKKTNSLIDGNGILRNSCLLAENGDRIITANEQGGECVVSILSNAPFAMVECKRVGVEEGCKKGPQTIEKAKQGAYVAQMTSSLQKIRTEDGTQYGLLYKDGTPIIKDYGTLLTEIVKGEGLLKDFILSIGIVSNHGNWFTAESKNKELKVLAQSYDWLLFLSDNGLSTFIMDLLLKPSTEYKCVKKAFEDSYKQGRKTNVFTKTRISLPAHKALTKYFSKNEKEIEGWFNVITPSGKGISELRETLCFLDEKDWRDFL